MIPGFEQYGKLKLCYASLMQMNDEYDQLTVVMERHVAAQLQTGHQLPFSQVQTVYY
jgi:hypothetical protein